MKRVLDACAGLGGKTGHIAQAMKNQGSILALDNNSSRLERLSRQLHQMGIDIVRSVTYDLMHAPAADLFGTFDQVMLDAPCSGLGVLRRNPDAKWKIQESMLDRFAKIQDTFLENLARLVNPRGHLVYAVCSSEPEEGRRVIEPFLRRHPEFSVCKSTGRLPVQTESLVDAEGFFSTDQHVDAMDGFFAVCLRRTK